MLIVNMKMPSCCDCCPILDDSGDYPTCMITDKSRGYNFPVREKRMPDCPLIEMDLQSYIYTQIQDIKNNRPNFFPLLSAALQSGEIKLEDVLKQGEQL